ncbi:MAG: serine hydrolase [Planctomycetes bacterium]|nr:serine hydrolase [Planctomycetota bacterium]
MPRSVVSSLLALALLVGAVAAQTSPPPHAPEVDWGSFARELQIDAGLPGLALGVVRDGEIVYADAFGVREHDSGAPADGDTIELAASLSMPVFAYAVMRVADRGGFDLDAPLDDVLRSSRVADVPGAERITARMVLSHASGLPNGGGAGLSLAFEPGTGFQFSSEGYVWLQRVMEAVTGVDLQTFVQREVFEPLGMTRSAFVWRSFMQGKLVSGRSWFRVTRPVGRLAEGVAAGSLMTTAHDYARFLVEVLDGELLSPDAHADFLREQVALDAHDARGRPLRLGFALGFGVQHVAAGEQFFLWGDTGDFKSWTAFDSVTRDALVLFVNDADGLSIAPALTARLLGDEQPALDWLGYERYDDADRRVRLSLEKSFRERGVDAGRKRFAEIGARLSPEHEVDQLRELGYGLLLSGRGDEALAVFELLAERHPDEPRAHGALADAHVKRHEWEAARADLARLLELSPDDGMRRFQARWLDEEIAAEAAPVTLGATALVRCEGDYGTRHVRLRDGRLVTWRDGAQDVDPLVPVTRDTFRVETLDGFRLRFVFDDDEAPARALVALHFDGTSEELARTR